MQVSRKWGLGSATNVLRTSVSKAPKSRPLQNDPYKCLVELSANLFMEYCFGSSCWLVSCICVVGFGKIVFDFSVAKLNNSVR